MINVIQLADHKSMKQLTDSKLFNSSAQACRMYARLYLYRWKCFIIL